MAIIKSEPQLASCVLYRSKTTMKEKAVYSRSRDKHLALFICLAYEPQNMTMNINDCHPKNEWMDRTTIKQSLCCVQRETPKLLSNFCLFRTRILVCVCAIGFYASNVFCWSKKNKIPTYRKLENHLTNCAVLFLLNLMSGKNIFSIDELG